MCTAKVGIEQDLLRLGFQSSDMMKASDCVERTAVRDCEVGSGCLRLWPTMPEARFSHHIHSFSLQHEDRHPGRVGAEPVLRH
jgi:hypothetical protein